MILKNFWTTLKRYKVASLLNIIGLSVAFAAFAIIIMQVKYDLTYDTFHSKHERIFRGESRVFDPETYTMRINRPLLRQYEDTYPEIEATVLLSEPTGTLLNPDVNSDDYPYSEMVTETTPSIFQVFDFVLTEGDTASFKAPGQVIISESQAKKYFPDGQAMGKQLKTYGQEAGVVLEIVGVYKDFPKNSYLRNEIYSVMGMEDYDDSGNWNYTNFLLLRSAGQREELQQQINDLLAESMATRSADWGVTEFYRLTPVRDTHYLRDVSGDGIEKANKNTVYTLLLIAFLIILIAAINFINFSMSLVPARMKSVNTRKVLGESLTSLRWNQVFEAMGICALAMILSVALISIIAGSSFSASLSADVTVARNMPIILATTGIALLTGLIAGIFPAFYQTSFAPALVLKGAYGLSSKGKKLRTVLISFQYVISFVLITVAIFVHVQNRYLRSFPLGMNKENVLVAPVWSEIRNQESVFIDELKKNPSIKSVGFTSFQPIVSEGGMEWGISYKGGDISFRTLPVSKDLIPTLGIELIEGRNFQESDEFTFIFNRKAKEQFGLELNDKLHAFGESEIVGFVEDFNFRPLHYPIGPIALMVSPDESFHFFSYTYIRVDSQDLPATIDYILELIKKMDPTHAPYAQVDFMDKTLGQLYDREGRLAGQITAFSLLAVLISLIGVFGLVLFETQYRRKEIGIRKINGATVLEILGLLNKNFVWIVAGCFVISAPIAYYAMTKWLEGFTYKSTIHVWIFIVALLIVAVITLLTVTLQSYRAATENPVNAIKTE